MSSFHERLKLARAEMAQHVADPLREKVETIMHGKEAIGTAPLLDLLEMRMTTASARRLAGTMRDLGFVPIKTRRFLPGGFRDTVSRGWARPVREAGGQTSFGQSDKVPGCHPDNAQSMEGHVP